MSNHNNLHIRKGDKVVVTAGRDKGRVGTVERVFPEDAKALVTGVNRVKRHQKPTQDGPSGILEKEMPIAASNLQHVDPKDGKPTRIGRKILENGTKVRYAKRSGEVID